MRPPRARPGGCWRCGSRWRRRSFSPWPGRCSIRCPVGGAARRRCLIVMDDGWPAAPHWDTRQAAASEERIEAAGAEWPACRPVAAVGWRAVRSSYGCDSCAVERLRAIKPLPYAPDHLALDRADQQAGRRRAEDGDRLDRRRSCRGHAREFAAKARGASRRISHW